MPSYPVRIDKGEEGRVLVTFPDVPEAVVCAESRDQAFAKAPEVLELVLRGYRSEHRPLPIPSETEDGAPCVASEDFDGSPALPGLS